jgi:tRNA/rRNA methyltransferase
LENALVFSSLKEAMTDLSYTLAFTRRLGKSRRRSMDVREAASKAVSFLRRGKVGMIFGPEESGLSNREISMADEIVHIPTGAKLPSINLSQSVIIACHELFTSALANEVLHVHDTKETFATKKEVASTIAKLEETLEVLDYKDQKDYPIKTKIINQFNKLFGRAGLTKKDLSMFSGLFARIRKTRG